MYNPTKPSTSDVLKLISSTWKTPYLNVASNTYSVFERKFDFPEVDHTDGIGTKGVYHWSKKTFKYAVLDAMAMNLNDLLLVRATAYKLQNHLVLPKDDVKNIAEIMAHLVRECKERDIAITGGETSIHDTTDSFDIGITMSGFIKKRTFNKAKVGDVVIGLKSNGLHSNGFSLVRKLFKSTFREDFVKPTKIYYDDLMKTIENLKINGMMHITGGAFSKLKGIIDDNQSVFITNKHSLNPQKIFTEIFEKGVNNRKMYTTFNCGIGFILTMPKESVDEFLQEIHYADVIGEIGKGRGTIEIKSMFDGKSLVV